MKMKKLLSLLLSICMLCGLVACGTSKNVTDIGNSTEQENDIVDADWKKGEFILLEKTYQLDTFYQEASNNGWAVSELTKEEQKDLELLESGNEDFLQLYNKEASPDDTVPLVVDFKNINEEPTTLNECSVNSIKITYRILDENSGETYPEIIVNGLKIGDSEETMLSLLGNDYNSRVESETETHYTYLSEDNYKLWIDINSSGVYSIMLSNETL